MKVTRYDTKLLIKVECDNSRRFRVIKRGLFLHKRLLKDRADFKFYKDTNTIYITCNDRQVYDTFLDEFSIKPGELAAKGYKQSGIEIIDGDKQDVKDN